MKFTRRIGLMLFVVSFIAAAGCATLNDIFKGNPGGGETLDEATVVAGLKEALQIGTQNTVLSTSKLDGYLGNQLIRIAVPEQLVSVASTLRQLGLGSQVDELEVGMNRAAERAAGEARDIFWNAITTMTVADAFGILRGGNTAATDYFHDRTAAALRTRFKPIIEQKIGEVGIANIYNQIAVAYNAASGRSRRICDRPRPGGAVRGARDGRNENPRRSPGPHDRAAAESFRKLRSQSVSNGIEHIDEESNFL
jgi:hypothetical protein